MVSDISGLITRQQSQHIQIYTDRGNNDGRNGHQCCERFDVIMASSFVRIDNGGESGEGVIN